MGTNDELDKPTLDDIDSFLKIIKDPEQWFCDCGDIADRVCDKCDIKLCDKCDSGTWVDECSVCYSCKMRQTYDNY